MEELNKCSENNQSLPHCRELCSVLSDRIFKFQSLHNKICTVSLYLLTEGWMSAWKVIVLLLPH